MYYACLESKKKEPNSFERFYEKGRSLFFEQHDLNINKSEIRNYAPSLLFNYYEVIFPIIGLSKIDVKIVTGVLSSFYKATINASKSVFTDAIENIIKVNEFLSDLTSTEWKEDIKIFYFKRLGQIYFNDKTDQSNQKKSIVSWQQALKTITNITGEQQLLYLFEKLDLFYLIGKNSYKFGLFEVSEANKYLLSGKNLLSRFHVKNSIILEFQFDAALGFNYFDSKDYEKSEKYFLRALEKHENKLYEDLKLILMDLAKIYLNKEEKDKLNKFQEKYNLIMEFFDIKKDLQA